ncbi:MAG TPA: DUF4156 domain-containing protein [Methylophilaceae bacterium]|jgi:hypothetical protein
MQFNRTIRRTALTCVMAVAPIALGACASKMVEVRPGSDRVSLADAHQVAACQSRGKVTVSVLTKVGFISRSVEAVEANLLQLARNSAVDEGADTLVRRESPRFGERTFDMYKCRP